MTPPALVLLDLDDTLCDYSGARAVRLRGAFSRALATSDVADIDLDSLVSESIAIHPHGSDHFPELLGRYGISDPAVAQECRRWYHQNRFLGLDLFPGAVDILEQIRSISGVLAIGLVTNGPVEVQRDKISLLDLWPRIDFAVISGELGIEKPDPRIFREALRIGGFDASSAIYIGDSPEFDMDGAYAAGIKRIWLNHSSAPWTGSTPEPEIQIEFLTELIPLLEE